MPPHAEAWEMPQQEENPDMLRYAVRTLVAALLLAYCGACANLEILTQATRIDRQIRADRVEFFQKMSDAYRILAFEYYKLASEAEKQKAKVQAQEYAARMKLYDTFYRQAQKTADDLRAEFRITEGQGVPSLPSGSRAEAPIAPAGGAQPQNSASPGQQLAR